MVESIVPIAALTAAKPRTLYTEETNERIKRVVAGGLNFFRDRGETRSETWTIPFAGAGS